MDKMPRIQSCKSCKSCPKQFSFNPFAPSRETLLHSALRTPHSALPTLHPSLPPFVRPITPLPLPIASTLQRFNASTLQRFNNLIIQLKPCSEAQLWHICSMTEIFRARVDQKLLAEAKKVAGEIGIEPADIVRLLFKQMVKRRAIPFPLQADPAEDDIFTSTERRNALADEF